MKNAVLSVLMLIIAFQSQHAFALVGGVPVKERITSIDKSVVLVELLGQNGQMITYCTGAVIGENTVLTAAHCFDPKIVSGVVGFNIVFLESSYRSTGARVVRPGFAHAIHKYYNTAPLQGTWPRYDHDMAVLAFSGGLPAGVTIIPVDPNQYADYGGRTITVYGYGRSQNFTGKEKNYLDQRVSAGNLRKGSMVITQQYAVMGDRYETEPASKSNLCPGDSGGPQFIEDANGPRIIGVNSGSLSGAKLANGLRPCKDGSLGIKVNIEVGWIHEQQEKFNKQLSRQR